MGSHRSAGGPQVSVPVRAVDQAGPASGTPIHAVVPVVVARLKREIGTLFCLPANSETRRQIVNQCLEVSMPEDCGDRIKRYVYMYT